MKQIFTTEETKGKVIKEIRIDWSLLAISFTDNTYLVIRAGANDGWDNDGHHRIYNDKIMLEDIDNNE